MSASKLQFRIVEHSGEDPEFPATELLNHGPTSKGWQSAKFCEYPQFLIVQFISPVRLRQIQFLSHQSKISSRIELYVFLPDTATTVVKDLSKVKFKRLGFLSLDSNERSSFQARELKSVYVDAQTMYLKVLLNKCHINRFNLCNQVGLVALNCLGEQLSAEDGVPTIIPQEQIQAARLEDVYTFDQQTAEKLKQLELAKEMAIENEDYDEARRLKEMAERLRAVGFQLLKLEERKKIFCIK